MLSCMAIVSLTKYKCKVVKGTYVNSKCTLSSPSARSVKKWQTTLLMMLLDSMVKIVHQLQWGSYDQAGWCMCSGASVDRGSRANAHWGTPVAGWPWKLKLHQTRVPWTLGWYFLQPPVDANCLSFIWRSYLRSMLHSNDTIFGQIMLFQVFFPTISPLWLMFF